MPLTHPRTKKLLRQCQVLLPLTREDKLKAKVSATSKKLEAHDAESASNTGISSNLQREKMPELLLKTSKKSRIVEENQSPICSFNIFN